MVYAFTLFTSFLAPMAGSPARLIMAALLLAAVSACANSAWALFGAQIKARLPDPHYTRWLNAGLALFLVYAAVDLAIRLPAAQ